MALNPHRGFSVEDIGANTAPLFFSDALTAAIYAENTLLPYLSKGPETSQVAMRWVEDKLNAFQVTANGTIASGALSLTLASGEGRLVRKGSVLLCARQGATLAPELVQVIDVTGDVASITRGYGGTTAQQITSADKMTVIGNPLEGNADLQLDVTKARVSKLNYCQVFEKSVDISRRQLKRDMVAVNDEFTKSIKDRTIEAKRELENALIYSFAKASNPDGDYSTMRGMLDLMTDASVPSSFIIDGGAAALTEANLNTWVAVVKAAGGTLQTIFTSQKQARVFSSSSFFGGGSATGIRWVSSDRVRGQYVRQYLTDSGWVLDILSNPFVRDDFLFLLNTELLSYHSFRESDWFMVQAPTFRDGKAARLIGDYTFKQEHAGETHLLVRNIG